MTKEQLADEARPTFLRFVRCPSEAVAIRVLEDKGSLSDPDRALIKRLSGFRASVPAGRAFWRLGQPVPARIMISGWACRQRLLSDGRRQIFRFLIPGDTVGVFGAVNPIDEVSTVALTRVECMDALMLREILSIRDDRHAGLLDALTDARRLEESSLLDQIVRLGRQSALERTAHLFVELRERCKVAGLIDGERFPMPLTQEILADALGLSVVHQNRTLQQLKKDRLIEMKRGWMAILDVPQMMRLADYGPHDC